MGKKGLDAKPSNSLRWTTQMDKVFLEALIVEEICGNRVDGTFTSKAYVNVLKVGIEKFGHPLTKDNLKNHLKTIKANFSEVNDPFNASGWGWNEETNMFENEEEVWNNLIEKKPEAAKWQKSCFHHYDLLSLCAKNRATGDLAATAKEKKLKAICESSTDKVDESTE